MTTIDVRFDVPGPFGPVPTSGTLVWTPTRRRVAADGTIVLPAPFRVHLSGGSASVEAEATTPEWVWKVEEHVPGGPGRTAYLIVPESAEPVRYADLVAVDPSSLGPEAVPAAAWWAAVGRNVQDAEVAADELVFTRQDGSSFNAGNVRGPQGVQGAQGPKGDTGPQGVQGPKGDKGAPGDPSVTPEAVEANLPARLGRGALDAAFVGVDRLYAAQRGAVIFCIDDCQAQAMDLVAVHDALGQKAVLGVVSAKANTANFMTTAQIAAHWQNGHELANHTDTHPDYTTITPAQRRTETDNCNAFIRGITGEDPVSFIYPRGAWNAATERELYGVFRNWRATLSATTNLPGAYPLGDTFPRYYGVDVGDPLNFERAKQLIRMAASSPVIVSTYVHFTNQAGVITTAQYAQLAQLAQDLRVPVVLARDVIGKRSLVADPSFEDAGAATWFKTLGGTSAITQETITPDAGLAGTKGMQFVVSNPDSATLAGILNVTPGQTLRCSGRIRQTAGTLIQNDFGVQLRFRNWDETALNNPTTYIPVPAAGAGWARFETDIVVPVGARFAWVNYIVAPGPGRSGTVQIDHVDVRPSDQGGLG